MIFKLNGIIPNPDGNLIGFFYKQRYKVCNEKKYYIYKYIFIYIKHFIKEIKRATSKLLDGDEKTTTTNKQTKNIPMFLLLKKQKSEFRDLKT